VCARGSNRALLGGPSTHPLDGMRDRQQYDQAFALLREWVTQWDPLGLIGGGAPPDEWDHEIARLLAMLRGARSPEDVSAAVTAVFRDSLGESAPDAVSCSTFSRELHAKLTSAKLLDS
jgi:hypothetical protein